MLDRNFKSGSSIVKEKGSKIGNSIIGEASLILDNSIVEGTSLVENDSVMRGTNLREDNPIMREVAFEKLFQIMNLMAFNKVLLWKVDYDTYVNEDGAYIFRINYNKFYGKLLDYCKTYNISHPRLNIKAFRYTLKDKPYCLNYSGIGWLKKDADSDESYCMRCGFIDIKALQARGIFIDDLLYNNRL